MDLNDVDNISTVTTVIAPLMMTIVTTVSPDTPLRGEPVTYTVTLTNAGTASYPAATFTDDLSDVVDDATAASATLMEPAKMYPPVAAARSNVRPAILATEMLATNTLTKTDKREGARNEGQQDGEGGRLKIT